MFKTTARNAQRRLDRQQLKDLPATGDAAPRKPAARLIMAIQELARQIFSAPAGSDYRAVLERRLAKLQRSSGERA